MKPFFVYLLRCADGSYYAGHTDDIVMRMRQHEDGAIGYTSTRKPVELVWQGEFEKRVDALAFELQVKGWSRAKKEALIAGDWERVQELARSNGGVGAGLRQAQPERAGGDSSLPPESPTVRPDSPTVRPEPVEGHARSGMASTGSARTGFGISDHPELVEGPEPVEGHARSGIASTGSARTGFGISDHPELVEGPEPVEGHARSGMASTGSARTGFGISDRPELVEGPELVDGQSPLANRILTGDAPVRRRAIAKSITLLESTRPDHRAQGDSLLTELLPHTGKSFRLGISGVPGVGKSTFIETLGLHLIAQGHRVAVLAVDPSSSVSGGSILGDKTRMEQLSVHPQAYIRPSPSSGTLGGVAEKTREAMLVCEAAGYDIVIVETVGVGQSETAVAGMTDMFVLMQLPNAGDDLQAIKKGVMELADLVAINKADIDPDAATRAQAQITSALRLFTQHGHEEKRWQPKVLQLSALKSTGVDAFWQSVEDFRQAQLASGAFESRRRHQALAWMWERIDAALKHEFRQHPGIRALLPAVTADVAAGRLPASTAARQLLQARGQTTTPH